MHLPICTTFGTITHIGHPIEGYGQLKFPTFKNPRWRRVAILKIEKRPYLRNALTDLHKIWHGDGAFWPSEGYGQLKFQLFKIQDGVRSPS